MLTIKYQDGSRRIVHPTADFYIPTELENRRVLTAEQKAVELAYALSAKPYHIILQKGKKVILDKVIKENYPILPQERAPKFLSNLKKFPVNEIEEKFLKREMRRKHKRDKFNIIIK